MEINRDPDLEYGLIHFLFHGCEMATLRLERLVFTGKRCGCFDVKCAEMGTRFSLQVPVGGSDGRETVPVEFVTETGSIFFRAFGKNASVLRGLGKKAVEIFRSMDGSDVEDGNGWEDPGSGWTVCGNGDVHHRWIVPVAKFRMRGLWEWPVSEMLPPGWAADAKAWEHAIA
jgi:hypothetical protein